jgi:hypothetical protein
MLLQQNTPHCPEVRGILWRCEGGRPGIWSNQATGLPDIVDFQRQKERASQTALNIGGSLTDTRIAP